MINTNFTNKIAAFYPIKLGSKETKNIFYIDDEKLPSISVVGFYIVLAGLQLHKVFKVHLTIIDENNQVIVDTDNTVNTDDLPEENIILDKEISTGTFSISPKPFHVQTGTHIYRAFIILKDSSENIYDNASTWFLTRPDPDKEH